MSLETVLRALVDHWESVVTHLDTSRRAEFIRLLSTATADRAMAESALSDLLILLVPALPADHPVSGALRSQFRRSRSLMLAPDVELSEAAVETEFRRLVHELERLGGFTGSEVADDWDDAEGWEDDPNPLAPEAIWARARRRLLAAPHVLVDLPPAADSDDWLLRLERPDGRYQAPSFQFDTAGRPLTPVLQINQLLDSVDDPWGVADWWLSANAWLAAIPARLLGTSRDQELLRAARAIGSDYA